MKRTGGWRSCFLFFCGILSILIAGCASMGAKTVSKGDSFDIVYSEALQPEKNDLWPDRKLKKRFREYWSLRFDGQVESIFEMEAPYIQEMVNPKKYKGYMIGSRANDLTEIEISGIEKKSDRLLNIKSQLRFVTNSGEIDDIYFDDEWVFVDKQWYHVLRDMFMFPELN